MSIITDFAKDNLRLQGSPIIFNDLWVKIANDLEYILKDPTQHQPPIIIEKDRQVGGTTFASVFGLGCTFLKENFKFMHLFPSHSMANEFARYTFKDLFLDCVPGTQKRRNGGVKTILEERTKWGPQGDTLYCKVFENGSVVRIESPGFYGDRLRGISNHLTIIDEAQMISEDALDIINRISKNIVLLVSREGQGYPKFMDYDVAKIGAKYYVKVENANIN